jgi:hypothetical protein
MLDLREQDPSLVGRYRETQESGFFGLEYQLRLPSGEVEELKRSVPPPLSVDWANDQIMSENSWGKRVTLQNFGSLKEPKGVLPMKGMLMSSGRYYIQNGYIYGPKMSGQFYIQNGYIYGPKNSGKYYIQDGYIYGPKNSGRFYIQNNYICGPNEELPWLED